MVARQLYPVFILLLVLIIDFATARDEYWLGCKCKNFVKSDVAILLKLKTYIKSDPYGFRKNWATKYTCATGWSGLGCDENGRVNALHLAYGQLTGTLPSIIGNLTGLMKLSVEGNNFTGPIPSSIGKLPNLQNLALGTNKFTGSIPLTFSRLSNLNYLCLQSNKLQGSVSHLLSLKKINFLNLAGNNFSGPIPPGLGYLPEMGVLFLSWNRFTGPIPTSFKNFTNLQILDLSYNNLIGPFPSFEGSRRKLLYLFLGSNKLSGALPPSLKALEQIRTLEAKNNRLVGIIPEFMGQKKHLSTLDLQGNYFTGALPASLLAKCTANFEFQGNCLTLPAGAGSKACILTPQRIKSQCTSLYRPPPPLRRSLPAGK